MGKAPHFRFERAAGDAPVCGVDEAGRGPWAGPVVAAAVVLDKRRIPKGLNDSKKLSPRQREALFPLIMESATVGIGIADVERIDRDNILAATMWAMQQAVAQLSVAPELALVDGNRAPGLACKVQTVVEGDGQSLSIAAASIIAKVTRDRMMIEIDGQYAGYGFANHKGYGTDEHQQALARLGPCACHRRSFAPVRALISR
jgi:ribonuclease HII